MSGFDVGWITHNKQNSSVAEDGPPVEKSAAQAKFYEFLRTFQTETEDQQSSAVYKYSDALMKDNPTLRVDLQHIKLFDPDLGAHLQKSPSECFPLLEAAAIQRIQRTGRQAEESQKPNSFEVMLYSSEQFGPSTLREVQSQSNSISQLVMIPAIVTQASNLRHKITHMTIRCRTCFTIKTVFGKPGFGGITVPRTCDASTIGGEANTCGLDPYEILANQSRFVDQQQLKLQDLHEAVPMGEVPQNMTAIVERHLVGKITPGMRITAIGIYSIYQTKAGKRQNGKRARDAVQNPYLRILGLQQDIQGDARNSPTFTLEEEAEFKAFAAQPNVLELIFAMIAPNIFGRDDVKKAVACLLFGGARKILPDGTAKRGDINVLLMGDPSTAKSQFLKFVAKTAPIAVYTSGKGSSAAGLTASINKDNQNQFFLEGGAMVQADNGVVCIDEFDKMRPEDRVAMHEAMEQQTISIAKAGITAKLNSRTSVLAAANPPSGRYDDMKTAQENMELQTTILSRFDLIFIVRDERSMDGDKQMSDHVLRVHRNAGATEEESREERKEEDFLKRYLQYCRVKCSPRLTQRAGDNLVNIYVDLRGKVVEKATFGTGEEPAVPITVRQLEGLVRISESLAKMQLQMNATEAHVQQAVTLFKASTMDAVASGATEGLVFTAAQIQEMDHVQKQIKRHVPIAGNVSTTMLVNELVRVGLNDSLVRRALVYLVSAGEFEYRRGRKLIHRLQ